MTTTDRDRVIAALAAEDVAIIPTDTVYGLVADPRSPAAVHRLLSLKGRSEDVPIAVLVGSIEQAAELVDADERFLALAARHWPGALTLVAPVRPDAGLAVGTGTTLGVRFPDDALVRAIADRMGPLAATSANRHGEAPAVDGTAARRLFGHEVEVIVDGGERVGRASTVVDLTGPELRVLREGDLIIE